MACMLNKQNSLMHELRGFEVRRPELFVVRIKGMHHLH